MAFFELTPMENNSSNNPAIVAAAETARAKIQAAYSMALHRPRNEFEARDKILASCKNLEFAEESWFKIDNKGEGFTIRFAEAALRAMRNTYSDQQTVYEDEHIRRIKVMLIDLETNTAYSKEVSISKTIERKTNRPADFVRERKNSHGKTVYVLRASDDEVEIKTASVISKAIRTEALRLIPPDIKAEAKKQIFLTIKSGDADPKNATKRLLDSFSSIGVPPEEVQRYMGKQQLSSISESQKNDLRGLYVAIKEGHTTWADVMAQKEDADPPKDFQKTDAEAVIAAASEFQRGQAMLSLGLSAEPGKSDPNNRNLFAQQIAQQAKDMNEFSLDTKERQQVVALLSDPYYHKDGFYSNACKELNVKERHFSDVAGHSDFELRYIHIKVLQLSGDTPS